MGAATGGQEMRASGSPSLHLPTTSQTGLGRRCRRRADGSDENQPAEAPSSGTAQAVGTSFSGSSRAEASCTGSRSTPSGSTQVPHQAMPRWQYRNQSPMAARFLDDVSAEDREAGDFSMVVGAEDVLQWSHGAGCTDCVLEDEVVFMTTPLKSTRKNTFVLLIVRIRRML